MKTFLRFLPIVATCLVCGLAIWSCSEALASARPSCNDSRGSTLAMHARVACRSVSRKARRQHPRWASHVYLECRPDSRSRSWCTWEIKWSAHDASCSGELAVVGLTHPRVHYGKQGCVA